MAIGTTGSPVGWMIDGNSYPIADELLRRGIPFAFATGLAPRRSPRAFKMR